MNELSNYYSNYMDYKRALDNEMLKVADGFVKIGYLLKYAQETNIIHEGGYESVNDFAKAEYNIDATQVSRFIRIHERFGIPGEARLQEHYINHGVAKLGIMLTLPDSINEEISADYSKTEINQIKAEIEAEQKISDIEVMCEEKDPVQQSLPEGFQRAVYQLIREQTELYLRMYCALTIDELKEIVAPAGECMYSIRIPGTGKLLMFVKRNENIVVTNVRTGEKESYEWEQLFDALKEFVSMGDSAKTSWENVFDESFPEEKKEEIAPVQPKEEDKSVRKESKVKVTPKPQPKPTSKVEEPVKEPEEQLPGQDNIMNHPEYLPDEMKEDKLEVLTGEVENIEKADKHNVQQATEERTVQQSKDGFKVEHIAPVQDVGTKQAIRGLKAAITAGAHVIGNLTEKEDWDMIISKATDIIWRAKKIKELEERDK